MKIVASQDKPRIAKLAERIADDIEKFMDMWDETNNIENVVDEEDVDAFNRVYDTLRLIDKEYTTVYRMHREQR